jgi:hypothetical protein
MFGSDCQLLGGRAARNDHRLMWALRGPWRDVGTVT